jgi:hypothetical protein
MRNQILTFNLIGTTLVFFVAVRLYLLPRLATLTPRVVLVPILLLHALRHLGLMFLAPGAALPGMPQQFACPAALGDLATAILAFAAIPPVAGGWSAARPLVWIFNVFGTADLIAAITLATIHGAAAHMGAAYWIPAFWVPSLLATHYVVFVVLAKHWRR